MAELVTQVQREDVGDAPTVAHSVQKTDRIPVASPVDTVDINDTGFCCGLFCPRSKREMDNMITTVRISDVDENNHMKLEAVRLRKISLLPPRKPEMKGKKCLVLDLDETLVHSSFQPIPDADFVLTIDLNNVTYHVYVRKRPYVDQFMEFVGKHYEVVIFTASLAKYADPLLDILDPSNIIQTRLFRESCVYHFGNFVKDLSLLGRPMEDIILLDNSPFSYMFQPDNAIPITSWFDDQQDIQLRELMPFLTFLATVHDVCTVLSRRKVKWDEEGEEDEQ